MADHDPTHGRIDRDIQQQVAEMKPRTIGQLVAIENTLQQRRDLADPEMSLEPTEHEGQGAGGAAATASPDAFTRPEWDSINAIVWNDLDDDPTRVGDLLAIALGTLAGIALDEHTDAAPLCARTLREIEQRSLWGPIHGDQEDHR